MAEKLDPKELITFEELLISNMYEIAALIELLDQQGIVAKKQILEKIQELRRKTPRGQAVGSVQDAFPEPYLNIETANRLTDQVLSLFNDAQLTSHQAKSLLRQFIQLVEVGERFARKTTH